MTVIDRMSLKGKVALVTGGNRGLGFAIAQAMGEAGASVALSARDLANAQGATDRLRALGIGDVLPVALDVTKRSDIERTAAFVAENLGEIDVLVNNAGVGTVTPALDAADDVWRKTFATNVDAVWEVSRIVARMMRRRGHGSIVNIGSVGATMVLPRPQAAYMASKGAVHQLTRALAVEWADYNIRVNAVAPGPFTTDMTEPDQPEYIQRVTLRRYGQPHELGAAVVFLASDAASFVTGAIITVDGGASL